MMSGVGESYREGLLDLEEAVSIHLKAEFGEQSVDPRYQELACTVVDNYKRNIEHVWFDLPFSRRLQMWTIDIIKVLHMETFIDKQTSTD